MIVSRHLYAKQSWSSTVNIRKMHDVLSKACKQFDPQERFYTIHQSIITFQSHIHFFIFGHRKCNECTYLYFQGYLFIKCRICELIVQLKRNTIVLWILIVSNNFIFIFHKYYRFIYIIHRHKFIHNSTYIYYTRSH